MSRLVDTRDIARSMACFPVIGLLLGAFLAVLNALLSRVLPGSVCDLTVIAAMVLVTGNMHGDGLMDTADGIYSGKPPERILEIMRDSRVGSHGVMAGMLVLLAKFILLGQIPPGAKWMALVLMPAVGRWAQVYCAAVYPYARSGGGTGGFSDFVGTRELIWASLTVAAAGAALFYLKSMIFTGTVFTGAVVAAGTAILAGIVVFAGTAAFGRYISRKIGGMTGDTLGAVNELAEVLALVVLLIIL